MVIHLFQPFLQGYAVSLVTFWVSIKKKQITEIPYRIKDLT